MRRATHSLSNARESRNALSARGISLIPMHRPQNHENGILGHVIVLSVPSYHLSSMRLTLVAALALGLVLSVGTVSAEEVLPDTAVPVLHMVEEVEKPLLKERIKGAQDQFLQHQAQVKERTTEFKQEAAARVESIRTNTLEHREVVKENVRELQDTPPKERGALMRTLIEERKMLLAEKRAAFASTTAEWRASLIEKRGEVTAARFDYAIQLMNAMVLRLTGLADRIDARISITAASGTDTSAAATALNSARESIADAEAAVDTLSSALADALSSEAPREALRETRGHAAAAKEAIRAAHTALTNAAVLLPRVALEPGA